MGRTIENNNVTVSGVIEKDFQYSHEAHGEKFYTSTVACQRKSGTFDYVPITVSERLVDVTVAWSGQNVIISGTFRSYSKHLGNRNNLILSVFVDGISYADTAERDENKICLDGYICKEVQYRVTPLGREVADIFLAVNRPFGKSDYIPCITWGRNAKFANGLNVGDRLSVCGRIAAKWRTGRLMR